MTNEERLDFCMNRNIRLSPTFIALTWDVFFVWTISTLFLTQVKGFSNSQVIALDSILMASGALLCVPVGKLFQNWSAIKASRIGLLGLLAFLLINIFGQNFATIILAQPCLAFGYCTLGIKTNTILTDSLKAVGREKDYQRFFGKGMSLYYIFECVGAIGIGYVYSWKPVMAFWLSAVVVGIAFLMTFLIKDANKFMKQNIQIGGKVETIKPEKKPDSFKKIMKSTFFVSLIVYMLLVRGILSISGSSFKIYLNFLINAGTIPMWAYGYLYAGTRLTAALFSKFQFKFSLKFGVKTLLIITSIIILSFVLTGTAFLINPTSPIAIVVIVIFSYIIASLRTPNQIFVNNYLQVCTPKRNHERVFSIRIMAEYLGYAIISAVYALLLSILGDNYGLTNLVYIGIFAIPLIASVMVFIRLLIKKHAQKYTVIKDEYTKD